MKKLIALVLCLMMTLGMVSFASAEFAPVAKENLKVGFVFIGDVSDKGYTYAHYQGLLEMQKALGLSDDQIIYKTNVAEDSACDTALQELVESGCQIIFGNSYGYMNFMEEMAEEYPEVIFSHCSGYKSNDVNFNNYFGAIYQARYLSGIAAGLKTQTNKIGFVAAMQTPEVIGGFDAFTLGVQSVNPDATVYVKYTNTWYDATLERQTADALLDMGCDVIAQHCDTANPQIAAQERGVWGCGYNADMTVDAPSGHLTAPVWNWGAVYTKEVQSVIDGTWAPENIFLDMTDGLVGLSPLSANCADGTAEAIAAAQEKILSGEFDVFNQELWDNQGNQITDANGCFVADIEGTSAKAGEPITRAFVAGELTFVLKGIEIQ